MKDKIQIALPLFTGFNNTRFEMDDNIDSEIDYFAGKYNVNQDWIVYLTNCNDAIEPDYTKYNRDVADKCIEVINEILKELFDIKNVLSQCIHSPKDYQYSNDSIYVEIIPGNNDKKMFYKKVYDFIMDEKENFKTYIKNNFTSYDGFISSYSNDYKVWLDKLKNFQTDDNEDTHILEFVCRNYEVNYQEDFIDEVMQDICHSEYLLTTDKFNDFMELNSKLIEKEFQTSKENQEDFYKNLDVIYSNFLK